MKKVTVKLQMQNEPLEIMVDDFDLKTDYYDYLTGEIKDSNGNIIPGVLIGKNNYIRLIDVVEIKVEDVE
ncbi:hypothetical protein [Enterococcus cecorum]|uniref:hypothetical protein n=1 Tax=Enterococcus cecorum TaxID=44008 RepID=UPI002ACA2BA4|nr:hypothetical protein [Enterococcus cecorum]MDZ5589965.1 hypothetical protein [Enterococcus cecorum]